MRDLPSLPSDDIVANEKQIPRFARDDNSRNAADVRVT
jgi:hypothetical protein